MNTFRIGIFALAALVLFTTISGAQSTDMDNPTPLYANVIDGEGDGKGETVYYFFTALKGDVKITVDGKTNYYSTPLRVSLMDEDGNELVPIYVVATGAGKREAATKRFVREQKVLVKISTQDDKDVKLLTYRIKLDGTVKLETPPAQTGESTVEQTGTPAEPAASTPTEQPVTPTPADQPAAEVPAEQPAGSTKPKSKVKAKAKEAAKSALKSILDN